MSHFLRNLPTKFSSLQITNSACSVFNISSRGKKTRKHNLYAKPRKPLHLGRAPSKSYEYFAKNYPTDKDLVKAEEVYLTYNRLLKSIAASFQQELVQKEMETEEEADEFQWDEEGHHKICMDYNDRENLKIAEARMKEIEKNMELRKIEMTKVELERGSDSPHVGAIEHLVKLDKESQEWLTLDNMDDKIEEALDNPINYNYAVTYTGMIDNRKDQTIEFTD